MNSTSPFPNSLSQTKLRSLANHSSMAKGDGSFPPLDYNSKSSTKMTADKRSNSRTLLRSTGKYAMSMNSASALDNILTKSGFSSTVDLSKPQSMITGKPKIPPSKNVGVITLEDLEGIRLRAVGLNEKTLDAMERTKTKMELHDKSRSRMANWNDTAEKYVERRRAEQLRRLEEEET